MRIKDPNQGVNVNRKFPFLKNWGEEEVALKSLPPTPTHRITILPMPPSRSEDIPDHPLPKETLPSSSKDDLPNSKDNQNQEDNPAPPIEEPTDPATISPSRVKFTERDTLSLANENFLRSCLKDSEKIKTF